MTTLDQVRLLEKKVESAVVKMQQLQAENDALRKKCAELTNALSSQSEQLSSFSSDKSEIEDGIKKALDRLSIIENSVIKAGIATKPDDQAARPLPTVNAPVIEKIETPIIKQEEEIVVEKKVAPASIQITPGISKINEEELHKVSQLNRTSVNAESVKEIKKPEINKSEPSFDFNNTTSYESFNSAPLNFDTMELSSQFDEDNLEDESYEMNEEESFDDMGIDNSFDNFNEEPAPIPSNPQVASKDPHKPVIY